MNPVQAQFESLQGLFGRLSFNQKIMLGTLTVAAAFAFFFFYNHAQEDFDVMLSGLDPGDANAVVLNLKQQGVPYRLAEGGTTILVPRSKKEELRLGVFGDDLIKSDKTVGYGALSSLPFGMTDWQQQKYDQKIISDEVVTTLEKIEGIKKARVIIAQGQDSLYSSDRVAPTASVMLIVEPGFRLKPEQVKTVRALVAHSVPGMKPQDVTLSDSMGNSLSDDMASAGGNSGSEVDNARSQFEKQKAKDILEMLIPVVGPNNAVVKVSASMNFDKAESKIKRFIPTGGTPDNPTGIPVSVQQNSEVYAGGDKDKGKTEVQGAPGTASNTPAYNEDKGDADKKKDNSYQNQQTTTNYEISSEEKTIVHAQGTVEKMSVAVIVNKVLTESETKELTNLISSAAGIDNARGDAITVSGLQFSPEAQQQQQESIDVLKQSGMQEMILQLAQTVGIFIFGLAALFVLYRFIPKTVEGQLVEEAGYAPSGGGGGGGGYLPTEVESLLGTASLPALEAKLDPEIEQMRDSINALVQKDPTEAARVLVSYIRDM